MRHASRALLAGAAGLAVSLLVACGGQSGLLSRQEANTLSGELNQVSNALNSGDCAAVSNASTSFNNDVTSLPSSVNRTLRQDLSQGATTVSQLALKQCQQAAASTPTTQSTPAPTDTTTTTAPDYDAIVRSLAAHRYRGWVSIEDGINGMDEMAESLALLRRMGATYFPDADD